MTVKKEKAIFLKFNLAKYKKSVKKLKWENFIIFNTSKNKKKYLHSSS